MGGGGRRSDLRKRSKTDKLQAPIITKKYCLLSHLFLSIQIGGKPNRCKGMRDWDSCPGMRKSHLPRNIGRNSLSLYVGYGGYTFPLQQRYPACKFRVFSQPLAALGDESSHRIFPIINQTSSSSSLYRTSAPDIMYGQLSRSSHLYHR
jgi:hypothetical protein